MTELVQGAFSTVNLPYTILLIVMAGFWCLTILGLLDLDAFDVNLNSDFDAGAGGLADGDIPGLSGQSLLGFLHVGEVPIMFYASIVVLSMWVTSMQVNYYLSNENVWIALLIAVPNIALGLLVAKTFTAPLKWIRQHRRPQTMLIGKMCLVTTTEVNETFGACEIETGEAPITLMVRTRGGEVLSKGDAAVVVERHNDQNIYIVTRYQENMPCSPA